MSTTYDDEYTNYKTWNTLKFSKSYHPKDLRKRNNAYEKKKTTV